MSKLFDLELLIYVAVTLTVTVGVLFAKAFGTIANAGEVVCPADTVTELGGVAVAKPELS